MKLLLFITLVLTGSILLVPKQKNLEGTWVLDTESKKSEVTVIRIRMIDGYFAGALDIPEQQVFDKPISIKVQKDSVEIIFDDHETCYVKAAIRDSLLVGRSVVSGEAKAVRFYRAQFQEK